MEILDAYDHQTLTRPEEAFNDGWDYPPRMDGLGIVEPRTCGDCSINLRKIIVEGVQI